MRLVTVHEVGWFSDPRTEDLDREARKAGVDVTIKGSRIFYAEVEFDGKRERWSIAKKDAAGLLKSSPVFAQGVSIELPEPTEVLEREPHVEAFSFSAGPHRAERI